MAEITIRISDKVLKTAGVVVIGLCLAYVGLQIWSSGILRPTYRLRMYVPESEGLAAGAPVRLNGMQVGTVDAIKLAEPSGTPTRNVYVVLRVQRRYQNNIRSDSTASLLSDGLLGGRFVNIHGGFRGSSIPPGGEIATVPTEEISMKDFIGALTKRNGCPEVEKHEVKDSPPTH